MRPVRAFAVVAIRPTVATNEATLVSTSSATLNATVNANFVDTTVAFSYATTADLSGATVAVTGTPVTGATDKTSTAALTDLKPATKYYYRASATNSIGTSTGDEIKNFTTTGARSWSEIIARRIRAGNHNRHSICETRTDRCASSAGDGL